MANVNSSQKSNGSVTSATGSTNNHTVWFLVAIYMIAIIWGIRSVWYRQPMILDFLIPFLLAVALGWWAVVDARRRQHPIPTLSKPWFFLFAGLLVPGYIIWSRGFAGLIWIILHSVFWYLVATVSMHIGGTIVFGKDWLPAMDT